MIIMLQTIKVLGLKYDYVCRCRTDSFNEIDNLTEWFDAKKNLQQAHQGVSQVRYDYVEHSIKPDPLTEIEAS